MSTKKGLLPLLLAITILLVAAHPVAAQGQDSLYFPETGHWVSGEFLQYYNAAKQPFLLFGYPITDAYQDPLTGLTVQYFQRVRFELHIEAAAGARVQLSNLGELLYQPGTPVDIPLEAPACRFFSQQKHYVCYAFLSFFDQNGGVNQFGNPLSDFEKQDNLYVQYFEKARFEWHPEASSGQWVVLSDLGKVYFDKLVGDPALLEPSPSNNTDQPTIQLQARAFVARAVISPNTTQVLFVVVQDQYLRPVSQANVAVTVHLPVGGEERYRLQLTNKDGISRFELPVGIQPYDQIVELDVEVSQGGLEASASTWFRIWW
ncbi:MAG: hypothetical protein M1281_14615 [Chloroflexi bacterium]|nr:hypothetical protein [Chloroflexota bacterium]